MIPNDHENSQTRSQEKMLIMLDNSGVTRHKRRRRRKAILTTFFYCRLPPPPPPELTVEKSLIFGCQWFTIIQMTGMSIIIIFIMLKVMTFLVFGIRRRSARKESSLQTGDSQSQSGQCMYDCISQCIIRWFSLRDQESADCMLDVMGEHFCELLF